MPHGLRPMELDRVCRVVKCAPQVQYAYLMRKAMTQFTDQPGYVLAIKCRWRWLREDRGAKRRLVAFLQGTLPVPCAVVFIGWRTRWIRRWIDASAGQPVFVAS